MIVITFQGIGSAISDVLVRGETHTEEAEEAIKRAVHQHRNSPDNDQDDNDHLDQLHVGPAFQGNPSYSRRAVP